MIKLAERIADVEPGATVLLIADDPVAEEDVRLWCRSHGHELVGVDRDGPLARIRVRRRR